MRETIRGMSSEHTNPSTTGQQPETTDAEQKLAERGSNRSQRPTSQAFRDFIASGWAPRDESLPAREEVADYTPARRAALSEAFAGERLIIPAGDLKVRSNDTDYRFRPHSAFAHLTGLGTDEEPGAVLVLEPQEGGGHEPTLYFRPQGGRDSEEFYANARYGEFWIGRRPTLADIEARTGLRCAHVDSLDDAIGKDAGQVTIRVVPGADAAVEARVQELRSESSAEEQQQADAALAEALSELRLTKDDWEIDQMRQAVDASIDAFGEVVRSLPRAVDHPRGERVIEGAFFARAREHGNGIGYDTIAASGDHATTLHWIRNHGVVRPGDLVLIDAGVEVDSLYTADITRTLPVDGTFTDIQRKVYTAVLDAADHAFATARPGLKFRDVHAAAMEVLADRLSQWGLLPVDVQTSLSQDGQHHRRWMPHGTSHHLGLDVHDCAQARREMYLDAQLRPGMIFTIEPGLYFKTDDLTVPQEYRGIGVRIEDDILVTDDGVVNLSAALPRTAEDVEAWMASLGDA